MPWSLRCRGPNGQTTLSGVDADSSVAALLQLLAEKTGIVERSIEILSGFPPRPVKVGDLQATLASIGLANGDVLTVRESLAGSTPTPPSPAANAAAPARAPAVVQAPAAIPQPISAPAVNNFAAINGEAHMDEDAALAAALAASLEEAQPVPGPAAAAAPTQRPPPPPQQQQQPKQQPPQPRGVPGPAPTSVQLPDGSSVTRRIIASDNSCLFNAVGYVMEASRSKAQELRRVIAQAVAADPVTYNDGFLGQENEAYCRWIQQPDKWGGAIELSILATHYGREIAAYDIQTKRCDIYGQGNGYTERSVVIYDGLHYDALALSAFDGAPEELDVTVLQVGSPQEASASAGAARLVAACHDARQFTDIANFSLRCGVCQIGLKGEKEAGEHAQATGHTRFSEY